MPHLAASAYIGVHAELDSIRERVAFLVELGDPKDQDEKPVETNTLRYLQEIDSELLRFAGPGCLEQGRPARCRAERQSTGRQGAKVHPNGALRV